MIEYVLWSTRDSQSADRALHHLGGTTNYAGASMQHLLVYVSGGIAQAYQGGLAREHRILRPLPRPVSPVLQPPTPGSTMPMFIPATPPCVVGTFNTSALVPFYALSGGLFRSQVAWWRPIGLPASSLHQAMVDGATITAVYLMKPSAMVDNIGLAAAPLRSLSPSQLEWSTCSTQDARCYHRGSLAGIESLVTLLDICHKENAHICVAARIGSRRVRMTG